MPILYWRAGILCSNCSFLSLFLRRNGAFLYVFEQKSGWLLHLPHPTTLPLYSFIYKRLSQKGSGVYLIKEIFLVEVIYMRPTGTYIFAHAYRRISPHLYTCFPISFSAFSASVQHKSVKGFGRKSQGFRRKESRLSSKSAKGFCEKWKTHSSLTSVTYLSPHLSLHTHLINNALSLFGDRVIDVFRKKLSCSGK